MRLTISTKNEFCYVPDIADNLKLPDGQKFKIIVRKINHAIAPVEIRDDDGNIKPIDMKDRVRRHIVRLENPPELSIDGKLTRQMEIDDLFNEDFSSLFPIVEGLIVFIGKIRKEGGIEQKKS